MKVRLRPASGCPLASINVAVRKSARTNPPLLAEKSAGVSVSCSPLANADAGAIDAPRAHSVNGHEVLPSGGQQISPLAVPGGGHENSPDRTFEVVRNHLLPVVFGESDGRADPFM